MQFNLLTPQEQAFAHQIFSTMGNGNYFYSRALQFNLDNLASITWTSEESNTTDLVNIHQLKMTMENGAQELAERVLENCIIQTSELESLDPAPIQLLELMKKVIDETITDYKKRLPPVVGKAA